MSAGSDNDRAVMAGSPELENREVTPVPSVSGLRRRVRRALLCLAVLGLAIPVAGWLMLPLVPLPQALFAGDVSQVEYLDRHGRPLRAVPVFGDQHQTVVSYHEMPQALVHATLAAEDRRFWTHPGVDWRGTLRAAWQLARHRRVVSGGSTITQQLIKLAEPRPRTLRTKIIEAAQALRLEQVWTKQRILAAYLNRIDYGNLNAGCAAAAAFYFKKPAADLSPAECALLAGLPQAPSRLNPHLHPARVQKRQQWILGEMRECGWLTEAEWDRAVREPLRLARPAREFKTPHFIDLVRQLQAAPGLRGKVVTSVDLDLNRFAEQVIRNQLAALRSRNVGDAAAVILDNRTGEVLALVGSDDYFDPRSGQVNGAWAPRSAGSAFKPFTYLLAFQRGFSPATVVPDIPTEFATPTGIYAPLNYDRQFQGPVRCRLALANSLNIPAVRVLADIGGAEPLRELLRGCGLTTLDGTADHYGLGLTIGNAEARLLELANAYACLARLGDYRPFQLLRASDADPIPAACRVADPAAAYLIADVLSDNDARALAFGTQSPLRFNFPAACKTGTSTDFRDNWAFGYTPEFTVGVWVGNFGGAPMRAVSGTSGAGPILHTLLTHLHEREGTSWYAKPAVVQEARVHPLTGKRLKDPTLTGSGSRPFIWEKFLATGAPAWESTDDYDSQGRAVLGPEYADWARKAGPSHLQQIAVNEGAGILQIRFPLPGTVLMLDPDLPSGGRRLKLEAFGPVDVEWRSDTLACDREGEHFIASLEPGRHHLVARDPASGAEVSTWVQVIRR